MKTSKKIYRIITSMLFYSVIVAVMVFSIANIQVRKSNDIAHIFGIGFLSVQSDSMAGEAENSFFSGDMIFVKLIDEAQKNQLIIGDIVTYYDQTIKQFNTHRIVDVYMLENVKYFVTQGDQTPGPDAAIQASEVLAVYQSSATGLGSSLDYLQSGQGFALFIMLPIVLVLVFEGVVLIKHLVEYSQAKYEQKHHSEYKDALISLEVETEKIRQQVILELKAKKMI